VVSLKELKRQMNTYRIRFLGRKNGEIGKWPLLQYFKVIQAVNKYVAVAKLYEVFEHITIQSVSVDGNHNRQRIQ
jgi:hypothetical protein